MNPDYQFIIDQIHIAYCYLNKNVLNDVKYKFTGCSMPLIGAGIYDPGTTNIQYLQIILTDKNMIIYAFAELIYNMQSNRIEIYNVCTNDAYRRQGKATILLKAINMLVEKMQNVTELYLGVMLNQNINQFSQKVKLYAKAGFTNKLNVTKKTFSGLNIDHLMMQKKLNKMNINDVDDINTALSKAKMFYKNSTKYDGVSKIRVHIRKNDLQTFKMLQRTKDVETGGLIRLRNRKFASNIGIYTFNGMIDRQSLKVGSTNTFAVNMPLINESRQCILSWHTHPTICYKKYGACIGTPSSADFKAYFLRNLYMNELSSIIFAQEGIYTCGVRKNALKILKIHNTDSKLYEVVDDLLSKFINKFDIKYKFKFTNYGLVKNQSGPQDGKYLRYRKSDNPSNIRDFAVEFLYPYNSSVGSQIINEFRTMLNEITIIKVLKILYSFYPTSDIVQLHPEYLKNNKYKEPIFHIDFKESDYESDISLDILYHTYKLKSILK